MKSDENSQLISVVKEIKEPPIVVDVYKNNDNEPRINYDDLHSDTNDFEMNENFAESDENTKVSLLTRGEVKMCRLSFKSDLKPPPVVNFQKEYQKQHLARLLNYSAGNNDMTESQIELRMPTLVFKR